MIIIQSPTMKDYIVEVLESYQGDVKFECVDKSTMFIKFKSTMDNEEGAALAKSIIKASEKGGVLYFQAKYSNE